MSDSGTDNEGRTIKSESPRTTARPLLEFALFYAAFYLIAFLPQDAAAAGAALGRAEFHLQNLVILVPRALFLAYFMNLTEGAAAFGLRKPSFSDIPRAFASALGAFGIALAASLALSGQGNPLLAAAAGAKDPPFLLVPMILSTALVVGYGEELFFRSYAMRKLAQAGFSPPWAALASSFAFAAAHGLQGAAGIAIAALLGLWFAWRWAAGARIHEIAIAHALYDAVIMLAAVYGSALLG